MSTIDTVENVLLAAKDAEFAAFDTYAGMLTRYAAMIADNKALQAKHAALREAVNRPVTEDELAEATITYMRAGPKNGEGVNTTQLRAAIETHIAALREEVGK